MLSLEGLGVSIAGTTILHDVRLEVGPRQTAGLIGRNGAGKTTLLRAVMGLLPLDGGRIGFDGTDLALVAAHRRAASGIGYMPEDRRLVPGFTIQENVNLPLWATGRSGDAQRLEWIFGLMPEIARFADRKAVSLSGGQQKLVALARALMCGTKLLLLDEPFEGVAPALAGRLAEVISDLHKEDVAVLLSESDYTHSAELLDRLYVIERGAVEERDPRLFEPDHGAAEDT